MSLHRRRSSLPLDRTSVSSSERIEKQSVLSTCGRVGAQPRVTESDRQDPYRAPFLWLAPYHRRAKQEWTWNKSQACPAIDVCPWVTCDRSISSDVQERSAASKVPLSAQRLPPVWIYCEDGMLTPVKRAESGLASGLLEYRIPCRIERYSQMLCSDAISVPSP